MTRPPAYHPGNFLMKNMNPTNGVSDVFSDARIQNLLDGIV